MVLQSPRSTPVNSLKRLARALRGGERGQTIWWMLVILPLFVIGSAIVIDTSVWYGHRRAYQNSADASALAGAQELFTRTTYADMESRATGIAEEWKDRNDRPPADFINNTPQVVYDCWGMTSYDGLPDGVIVDVSEEAPLLFMRAFKAAGFNIGGHAKVCLGTPQLADNFLPLGQPVNSSPCFDQSTNPPSPLFGSTCDISLTPSSGQSGEAQWLKLFDNASDDPADWSRECSANNANISNQDFEAQFVRGARTWCSIALPGATCGPASVPSEVGYCIDSDTGNRSKFAIQGLQTRLLSEGECNDLYGPGFGTSADGIDQWWEAFCVEGVGCGADLLSVVPGPGVTFVPRLDCHAARFVALVLLDEFASGGQGPYPIRGFAGFFIEGCHDDDGVFNPYCRTKQDCRRAGLPEDDCLSNTGHIFMQGMFMQYVDIGGPGGPATPYGRMQIYLVE